MRIGRLWRVPLRPPLLAVMMTAWPESVRLQRPLCPPCPPCPLRPRGRRHLQHRGTSSPCTCCTTCAPLRRRCRRPGTTVPRPPQRQSMVPAASRLCCLARWRLQAARRPRAAVCGCLMAKPRDIRSALAPRGTLQRYLMGHPVHPRVRARARAQPRLRRVAGPLIPPLPTARATCPRALPQGLSRALPCSRRSAASYRPASAFTPRRLQAGMRGSMPGRSTQCGRHRQRQCV
jgi:hypothetical protein